MTNTNNDRSTAIENALAVLLNDSHLAQLIHDADPKAYEQAHAAYYGENCVEILREVDEADEADMAANEERAFELTLDELLAGVPCDVCEFTSCRCEGASRMAD